MVGVREARLWLAVATVVLGLLVAYSGGYLAWGRKFQLGTKTIRVFDERVLVIFYQPAVFLESRLSGKEVVAQTQGDPIPFPRP